MIFGAIVVRMASFSGFTRRLRAFASLPAEVPALRETVDQMNNVIVTQIARLKDQVHALKARLDADTAIGAAQVIERQLSELEHTLATLRRDG